jgi:hypothetical protein
MPLTQKITKAYVASFTQGCQHCAHEVNRALLIFELSSVPLTTLDLEKYAFTIVRQGNRFLVGLKCGGEFEIEVASVKISIVDFTC